MHQLSPKDQEFKELAEMEEHETKVALGEYIDKEETNIVGR